MNHFKTIFFNILILSLVGIHPARAELGRKLKASEITVLSENVRENPSNLKSRIFLGDHYYRAADFAKVIQYLEPMAESLPDESLFKLSMSYFSVGDYRLAESMANLLLSRSSLNVKNHLQAIEIYSQIIDQMDPQAPNRQALIDKIFNTLKAAKSQAPNKVEIYEAWLSLLEKYIPHFGFEALRVVEDMKKNEIVLLPKHYSKICYYNHQAKFVKETKIACQKAMIKDPNQPSNHIYYGQAVINSGEEDKGKRVLASVGEKFSDSEEALWATAESYFENEQLPDAYTFYKKASEHKGAKPRDWLGLAKTAFKLKKFNEALEAFTIHCNKTKVLDQEFRRASGLLKNRPEWHNRYRQRMMACKP